MYQFYIYEEAKFYIQFISDTYLTLFLLSSQLNHENSKPRVGLQDVIWLLTAIKQSSCSIYAKTKWDLASFYIKKTEVMGPLIQLKSLEIPA